MTAPIAAVLALGVGGLVAGGVAWTVYLLRVGSLDGCDLAAKTAIGHPRSALHWPELRFTSVLPDPEEKEVVVVSVTWPAHPSEVSLLVLRPEGASETRQLLQWCATQASVTTNGATAPWIEFRRRRTLERVHAFVLGESPGPSLSALPGQPPPGR
jgi:hypothetical protein